MFTGIVTDLGRVRAVERPAEPGADARFSFETAYDPESMALGASIACSGACLTVVDKGQDAEGRGWFAADVSAETLSKTTLGDWRAGTPVNFERALCLGDELGGHLVSGHVDGVATVRARDEEGGSIRLAFAAPRALMPFIAPKGSVVLDGVSLTVNAVDDADTHGSGEGRFEVNIVPHTARVTTLGGCRPGIRVNLEIDLLARYVQRLLASGAGARV